MSDVKVPWEMRLGAVGKNAISKRLSYFSTITEVPHNADVGIDFLCELVRNDTPWLRYNVQAKGTEHFDEKWGKSIKKSTVLYWLRQQDPVFLIVYDDKNGDCYWMSIEDRRYDLLDKVMKRDPPSDTIYVQMDRSHVLEDGKNKNADFKEKVFADKYSIEQFLGRPQLRGEGYVKTMPPPPRTTHEVLQTKDNVRIYLTFLTLYYLEHQDMENAYLCCEFLTRFDKEHYNQFALFGYICMKLGDIPRAIDNFAQAIKMFEEDPNWPIEDKKNHIAHLMGLIDSCRRLKNQKS